MNPQQIQQVRQVTQEQIQPFQKQQSIRIDELNTKFSGSAERINELNTKMEKFSGQTENPQLKTIIENQEKENENLKKIITQQKDELTKMSEDITKQVNNHTKIVDTNIAKQVETMVERINKLENGGTKITIPAEELGRAVENYYKNRGIKINKQLDDIKLHLESLEEKTNDHNILNDSIEKVHECLKQDMPDMAREEVTKKLEQMVSELNTMDIDKTKEEIITDKEKVEELTKIRDRLKQFEI